MKYRLICISGLLFPSLGCFTTDKPAPLPEIAQSTVLKPSDLAEASREALVEWEKKQTGKVRIPVTLVQARQIVRARAELREGPGTAYYVLDKILTQGAKVIVTERYFRWRKVTAPELGVVGWLHEKTLSKSPIKEGFLTVDLKSLPSLFTPRKVKKIYDYETSQAIATKFPKGTKFYRLKKVKNKYLVIIEDTLSIAWINEGDLI